jgi:hypothetical protein
MAPVQLGARVCSQQRGNVTARATPKVPPAWPGRAEAPPNYVNRDKPKVRRLGFPHGHAAMAHV